MKTKIVRHILVGAAVFGFFYRGYDYCANKGKEPWGHKADDVAGVWKADGMNYGRFYKSDVVSVETIRTLRLELCTNGTFQAENWPFEAWDTGQVVVVPEVAGTWVYNYSEKDRFGVLKLSASKKQPLGHIGDSLYWMPEMAGKSLRLSRRFARLYLEKVDSPNSEKVENQ
ncbi:MAG: hypothetical protein ACOX9C_02715 [Kiritimatiellia bacterium]|jgi:hypothetical protein